MTRLGVRPRLGTRGRRLQQRERRTAATIIDVRRRSGRFLSSAGEIVEVAVRPSEVQPLPVAVPLDRADYFDPRRDELAVRDVDVVDFEQGDRAARLLTEEREVRIPGANT
jgi:hypothetical protein